MQIDKSQVMAKNYQEKFRLFKKIEGEMIGRSKIKNQSLAVALSNAIIKNKIEAIDQKWLDFLFKIYVEENYGAALQELSAEQFGSSSWFSGGDYILPRGYDKVPLALSQGINVKLKQPANRIEKLTNGDFQVSFESAPPMVCQHVIVTVPLSLLQRQTITFIPPLPSRKTKSIQNVGFGQFTKIFVRLTPTKVKQLKNHPTWIKVLGSDSQRGFQFFNLPHYSESDVLVGIAVSDEATLVENMSAEKLSSYVLSRAPFLEKKDIISIENTQWGKNKWAHGSYSYPKVGSRESDFDEIGKSIDRLHFAGEACQSDVYGTVEAAFLSGQRAAAKII
ncbi:MAG: FAD-dependent oxidoreductase [Bdellovibrionales bacterium]|nr:FAD-dependent oxidoreductase [Bdellovibrionales bacterium]